MAARDAGTYDEAGWLRRGIRRTITRRPLADLSARMLPTIDRAALRLTRGRWLLSGWLTGLPVVRLVTVGARTGLDRSALVMAIPDADGLLVAAANFGSDRSPGWLHNVRTHPDVRVVVAGTERPMRAEELRGEERELGFESALRMNPSWVRFRRGAGARTIAVLRLAPQ